MGAGLIVSAFLAFSLSLSWFSGTKENTILEDTVKETRAEQEAINRNYQTLTIKMRSTEAHQKTLEGKLKNEKKKQQKLKRKLAMEQRKLKIAVDSGTAVDLEGEREKIRKEVEERASQEITKLESKILTIEAEKKRLEESARIGLTAKKSGDGDGWAQAELARTKAREATLQYEALRQELDDLRAKIKTAGNENTMEVGSSNSDRETLAEANKKRADLEMRLIAAEQTIKDSHTAEASIEQSPNKASVENLITELKKARRMLHRKIELRDKAISELMRNAKINRDDEKQTLRSDLEIKARKIAELEQKLNFSRQREEALKASLNNKNNNDTVTAQRAADSMEKARVDALRVKILNLQAKLQNMEETKKDFAEQAKTEIEMLRSKTRQLETKNMNIEKGLKASGPARAKEPFNMEALREGGPLKAEVTQYGEPFKADTRNNNAPLNIEALREGGPLKAEVTQYGEPLKADTRNNNEPFNMEALREGGPLKAEVTQYGEPFKADTRNNNAPLNIEALREGGPLKAEVTQYGEPLKADTRNNNEPFNIEALREGSPLKAEITTPGEMRSELTGNNTELHTKIMGRDLTDLQNQATSYVAQKMIDRNVELEAQLQDTRLQLAEAQSAYREANSGLLDRPQLIPGRDDTRAIITRYRKAATTITALNQRNVELEAQASDTARALAEAEAARFIIDKLQARNIELEEKFRMLERSQRAKEAAAELERAAATAPVAEKTLLTEPKAVKNSEANTKLISESLTNKTAPIPVPRAANKDNSLMTQSLLTPLENKPLSQVQPPLMLASLEKTRAPREVTASISAEPLTPAIAPSTAENRDNNDNDKEFYKIIRKIEDVNYALKNLAENPELTRPSLVEIHEELRKLKKTILQKIDDGSITLEDIITGTGKSSTFTFYKIQENDTLRDIAGKKEVYGNPLLWPLIYRYNQSRIDQPDIMKSARLLIIYNTLPGGEKEDAIKKAQKYGDWDKWTKAEKRALIEDWIM